MRRMHGMHGMTGQGGMGEGMHGDLMPGGEDEPEDGPDSM
jgi:hypothetical protein